MNTTIAMTSTIADLQAIVGDQHVLVGADVTSRHDSYPPARPMEALCIVRPANTGEISSVLAYCDKAGLKVVPQGGVTGLVGGARTGPDEVALSLERLRRIGVVDADGATLEVEAGVPLEAVQAVARDAGFLYPVDLGARGSATIGGTIATNAGGNSVFRYGMTREQVLGLEAVLADGTVVSSMNRLIKNNSGHDLKQMFIGSEGTLGIVTRAMLRLQPQPGAKATAFVGLRDFTAVLALLKHGMAEGDGTLTSFEVMWPTFVTTITAQRGTHAPLAEAHHFYVLMEIASHRADALLEHVIAGAWELGVVEDAVIASSLAQTASFWAFRDDIDGLIAAMNPVFLYDVSLPQSAMLNYVGTLDAAIAARWPSARLVTFGHIADGNLHLFITTGSADDHHAVDEMVYAPLHAVEGSISAEHGIGIEKRDFLAASRSAEELALMLQLKRALDPRDTLNSGKIFMA